MYLLVQQRRHPDFIILNQAQIDAMLGRHELLPTLGLPAIQAQEELPDLRLGVDDLLDLQVWASKLQLVPELRHASLYKNLCWNVLIVDFEVRRADREDVAD